MRIVHATGELFPYIKTGGLADVVGAVTNALAGYGHEVAAFLPGYRPVLEHPELAGAEKVFSFGVDMGSDFLKGEIRSVKLSKNLTVYLVCRDEYFDRRYPYGPPDRDYEDNAERFIFFSKAVVEVLVRTGFKPDIVHCHDWQTALIPLMLRIEERRRAVAIAGKTVFTIHNLAFQGIYPHKVFELTNLPVELLNIDGLEFYGQVNLLKGGILFSDQLTTVSPTYAREILTPEFGCGLEGLLSMRSDELVSVLNGIDQDVWDPQTDSHLPANYSNSDLKGKETCRRALLRECGFDERFTGPVFAMICRFTEQKGMGVLLEAGDFFAGGESLLILLGSGQEYYERKFTEFATRNSKSVYLGLKHDEGMSHLIEAGSDFFLMPSIFEPCGLNQMYSQRYGTVPVVSRVGGLADTVIDIDESPGKGTGIHFSPGDSGELRKAMKRATALFADKKRLGEIRQRGMKTDFGWKTAARAYESLYREII